MTDEDYPAEASRKNERGRTRFRLVVTPDGAPYRCDVLTSSGHADLDQQTCALMMHRSEFHPAKGADGQAVYGTFTSSGIWQLPGMPSVAPEPISDLDLTVLALPKSVRTPAKIRVGLLIRPDGTIQDCKPKQDDKKTAILGSAACRQAKALSRVAPILDTQNNPVYSVQDMEISFSVAP